MWNFSIRCYYFIILLQHALGCHCNNRKNSYQISKHKVEIGNKSENKKRQTSKTIIEDIEKSDDVKVTGVHFNEISQTYETSAIEIPNITKEREMTKEEDYESETVDYPSTKQDITDVSSESDEQISTESSLDIRYITNDITSNINFWAESSFECKYFKKAALQFNLNEIADIWKIVYYTISTTFQCFSLYIKNLSNEDQQRYAKVYGNFNNTVEWNKCFLEITSNGNDKIGIKRKHFLQAADLKNAIMKNIIIIEEHFQKMSSTTLQEESPDQWLVIENLLLMRDCSNGHLVVFTRVPADPGLDEIKTAVKMFGETELLKGNKACLSRLNYLRNKQ